MTLNRFEQICKDYGLRVIEVNLDYIRAFYKDEIVTIYYKRRIYCYSHPSTVCYDSKTMLIDNGESTEVYSTTELENNIVQTIENLKKIFIKIKKFEIDKEFE